MSSLSRAFEGLASLGRLRGQALVDADWRELHRLLSPCTVSLSPAYSPARLARLARHAEVAGLAFERIPALRTELEGPARKQRQLDAILELGLVRLSTPLLAHAQHLPVALLKGSAAAHWAYRTSHLRFRRDLDLLVGLEIGTVRRILRDAGWRDDPGPGRSLSDLHDRNGLRAWPMTIDLGSVTVSVDLHRRLVDRPWCQLDPEALLSHRIPRHASLPVTDVVDTFLHTVAHLVQGGFHDPLKCWLDLVYLLPLVDAPTLVSRAKRYSLATSTWLSLDIIERWFGLDTLILQHPLAPPAWRRAFLRFLSRGQHDTPERRPLPRATSRRLWPLVLSDLPLAGMSGR